MKNAPCARLGIRISPKMSEKPDDNRNSRPPKATLFSVWMIQNCHCIFQLLLGERIPNSPCCHCRAWHRKSGLPDLRRSRLRNSGKPEFRCNPSFLEKTDPRVKPGGDRWWRRGIESYCSRFFAGG